MAVDNPDTINSISISNDNKVTLTILDHINWEDENEHLFHLENKIASYLDVIENNQISEIYPEANQEEILIQINFNHSPNEAGILFLNEVKLFLESKNFEFIYLIEN